MPSGSRPVHPLGRRPRPLKYPGRPRDQAWRVRVKPEVAALLLAQGPASHSLAAGLLASANTAAAWQVG
jgi:hypothetical protein